MQRRWVLTRTGAITAAGNCPERIFDALLEHRMLESAAGPGEFPALRILDFDPRQHFQRKRLGSLSRTSQLVCSAASRVVENLNGLPGEDVGIVFGSAWASLDSVVRFEREAHTEGPRFVDPILFTETVANVPAGHASIFFGWSALNATVSAGTASGLEALRQAVRFLEEGRARAIVAGGGDELNEHLLRTLHAERRNPPSGPIGSEGACVFVLEEAGHAIERNAVPLGTWLAGVGDCLASESSRADRIRELLVRAELAADAVDLVVLSANGSPDRDALEAAAVADAFGSCRPSVIAPKAVLGETWGAGGPLGLAVAFESMRRSIVPGCPEGLASTPGLAALNLSPDAIERSVRHAIVLDCSESGMFSGVAVASPG